MYSSEDLERFYFQYQTEALPHGESLQLFCVKNQVPYNIFQKWFKDTRKKVVEVQVDGAPVVSYAEQTKISDHPTPVSKSCNANPVRIWIDIRISDGLLIPKEFDLKKDVLSKETYLRNSINYSEGMADDQKDRCIQYLAGQNQELRLTSDAMKLVLEDFMAQMEELKNRVSSLQSKQSALANQLSEERKLRKSAERKAKSLQEKLDFANQERFGDRRQRINSKAKKSDSDRQKEKDDYDGTDDTLRTDFVYRR